MLKPIIILALILISFQDFKERMVYWLVFPFLIVLLIFDRINQKELIIDVYKSCVLNIVFFVLQLILISAYFSIKNKRLVNILAGLLGFGDVLFIITVACYLSSLNFLFFYISSLIFSLLGWLLWKKWAIDSGKQIPLAGIQAILFAIVLILDSWYWHVGITKDNWISSFLYKWI